MRQRHVDGTTYLETSTGMWTAFSSLEPSSTYLAPNGPDNSLAFFRDVSLGGLTTLGRSNIGGISTTEYRATVSEVKLFLLGASTKGGLTYIAYRMAQSNSLLLALPVEVWVDAKGQILQARAKSNPVAPNDLPVALASSGESATISISDFGVPVRVSAPPARDVIPKPTITSSPNVSGTLYVRGVDGAMLKESGLLSFTAPETGSAAIGFNVATFSPIAVGTNGTFDTDVLGYFRSPENRNMVATFYPEPSRELSCQLEGWPQLSSKKATKGYNIVCS